jgi:hypothetical protein
MDLAFTFAVASEIGPDFRPFRYPQIVILSGTSRVVCEMWSRRTPKNFKLPMLSGPFPPAILPTHLSSIGRKVRDSWVM